MLGVSNNIVSYVFPGDEEPKTTFRIKALSRKQMLKYSRATQELSTNVKEMSDEEAMDTSLNLMEEIFLGCVAEVQNVEVNEGDGGINVRGRDELKKLLDDGVIPPLIMGHISGIAMNRNKLNEKEAKN